MSSSFDPEAIDLQRLAKHLRERYGEFVTGLLAGKTHFRDEAARLLGCSLLEAERIIDTMVGRCFLVTQRDAEGSEGWGIRVW